MSKTIDNCIKWIEMIRNSPLKPNVEDLNYLNSIQKYLEELKEEKKARLPYEWNTHHSRRSR